jgi:hypothetical protein
VEHVVGVWAVSGVLGGVAVKAYHSLLVTLQSLPGLEPPPAPEGAHFGPPLVRSKGGSATRVAETWGRAENEEDAFKKSSEIHD